MRKLLKAVAFAAVLAPAFASAEIEITMHNLSADGDGVAGYGSTATEICRFCHTPHKGRDDQKALWNRDESLATFNWDGQDNSTNYETGLPTTLLEPSLKCMSCHDGTLGLGQVLDSDTAAIGNMTAVKIKRGDPDAGFDNDILGRQNAVGATALDLTGNHPVSVPYPTDATVAYNSITTGVTDFTQFATVQEVKDATLKVYVDPDSAGSVGIECGSCHDPHGVGTGLAALPDFLRVSMVNSELCLACHKK